MAHQCLLGGYGSCAVCTMEADEGNESLEELKKLQIKKLDLDDPKARAKFEQILKELDEQFRPLIEANEASSRITAEDLAIVINAKG